MCVYMYIYIYIYIYIYVADFHLGAERSIREFRRDLQLEGTHVSGGS